MKMRAMLLAFATVGCGENVATGDPNLTVVQALVDAADRDDHAQFDLLLQNAVAVDLYGEGAKLPAIQNLRPGGTCVSVPQIRKTHTDRDGNDYVDAHWSCPSEYSI